MSDMSEKRKKRIEDQRRAQEDLRQLNESNRNGLRIGVGRSTPPPPQRTPPPVPSRTPPSVPQTPSVTPQPESLVIDESSIPSDVPQVQLIQTPPPPTKEQVAEMGNQFDNPTLSDEAIQKAGGKATLLTRARNEARAGNARQLIALSKDGSIDPEVRKAAKDIVDRENLGKWSEMYDFSTQLTELSAITQDYEMNKIKLPEMERRLKEFQERGDVSQSAKDTANMFRKYVPLREQLVTDDQDSPQRSKLSYKVKAKDPDKTTSSVVEVVTDASQVPDPKKKGFTLTKPANDIKAIKDMDGNILIRPGASGDLRGLDTVANTIHKYVLEKPPKPMADPGPQASEKQKQEYAAYKSWNAGLRGAESASKEQGSQLTKNIYSHAFASISDLPDRQQVQSLVPTRQRSGVQRNISDM